MLRKLRGFTLIELLVVIAIIALLISILLPSLSRARELSKRLVCQSNIKGIGTSCKIYANDNSERWPTPPFDRSLPDSSGSESVYYYLDSGFNRDGQQYAGIVGKDREWPSFSVNPNASTQVSVTRAFWLLVRSGSVTTKQYVCPSAADDEDPTENIELYYDFDNYNTISYGYQVPFGPRDTRPREGMDNRQVVIADKGPFYLGSETDWRTGKNNEDVTLEDSPRAWRAHNSPNHGGRGQGEGQQTLFADGHATFERTPCAGIDNDNIYTLIENEWNTTEGFNRIHGELPGKQAPPPFPGQLSLGSDFQDYAATDSLLYP